MMTLLINERSCGNLPDNLRDLMLLLRHVIITVLFAFLFVLSGFQELHRMIY